MKNQMSAFCLASLILVGNAFAADATLNFPYDLANSTFDSKIPKNKKLFVDFWASWCGPCKESFSEYNAIQKKFSNKNIEFIAINEDNVKADAESFLKSNPLGLTVYYDKNRILAQELKVKALPTLFIFNADGSLKLRIQGFHKNRIKEIESALD